MRITHVRVQNYRSIEDTDFVPMERVTALVGRNESGKTRPHAKINGRKRIPIASRAPTFFLAAGCGSTILSSYWIIPLQDNFGRLLSNRSDGARCLERKSLHSEAYQTLIGALVDARKDAGLTQSDLAARLNKPQSWVAKYEGRVRRLDVLEFYAVARAMKFDPGELFAKVIADLPKRVSV